MPTNKKNPPPGPGTHHRAWIAWFPVLVLITAVAIVGWIIQSNQTEDLKYSQCAITLGVVLILWTIWFAFHVAKTRPMRWIILLAPFVLYAGFCGCVRMKLDGNLEFIGFEWRWTPPADLRLQVPDQESEIAKWQPSAFDYPRFLGPNGNGVIPNSSLDPDWESHPPRKIWQDTIGAGWSGFAIVGAYAVTQEQRSENEMVVCRQLIDGKIVWTHRDKIRFDPSHLSGRMGGPGPRATPTIHNGRVFTHGATGRLNCLDARTGEILWSHDTITENGGELILWGKSGSPLIVDHNVVVSVGGPKGKSLIAYDMETGEVAWSGGDRQSSYATPVLTTLAGIRQIVCVNENWVTAHRAEDGTVLWEHPWPGNSGADATCSNPIPVDKDRILLCKGYNVPSELLHVTKTANGQFSTKIIWRKLVMRTKMTNAIRLDKYVYGLDGGILQCIELETGKKRWKQGRYGHGQVLAMEDLLLVTTERTGEVVLVQATPDAHRVLAQFQAIHGGGKVWNYPAISGKYLLVRNAEEVACYELPVRPH
ncbi:MAG: PQQ-like beta-propeller repeat protein [Pirellulales bacterium]|nr:PQQ-like beta-propeller repeat protein [Pirellulales bacterium]